MKSLFRRFLLWANLHKRWKFRQALNKYADKIALWEQQNDGPPPIVWSPGSKEYVWVVRKNRRGLQRQIVNSANRIIRGK